MILYFSGTGNSKYVAEELGKICGDTAVNVKEKIRAGEGGRYFSVKPYVFVCPTYAWRIPRVFQSFIENSKLEGSKLMYFVMTCGGEIGNSAKYLKELCKKLGMSYAGTAEIVMPENYTAMFAVPNQSEANKIIVKAQPKIALAGEKIVRGLPLPEKPVTFADRFKSDVVNPAFYPLCVKADKFYSTDLCTSCGRCAELCPLGNISVIAGKPHWGDDCTHCMACINACPAKAVEFADSSKGKPRYYNLISR